LNSAHTIADPVLRARALASVADALNNELERSARRNRLGRRASNGAWTAPSCGESKN
jgi:hypothetical protein